MSGLFQAFGSLFSDDPEAPPPLPPIESPPTMPIPDDEAVKAARRRSIATSMRRRGRASTILTDPVTSEPLGG